MTILQVMQAAKKLHSLSQVGDIIQGAINSATGANTDMSEERLNVCRACPLFNNYVCDSTKKIIKVAPTPGDPSINTEITGCGCNLPWKVTIPNQYCPAGKWLPKSEKEFYHSEELHNAGIFVIPTFFAKANNNFYELDNFRSAFGSNEMMNFFSNIVTLPISNSPVTDFINTKLKNFLGNINTGEWVYRVTKVYSDQEKDRVLLKGDNFMIAPLEDFTVDCGLLTNLELKKGNLYTFVPQVTIKGTANKHYLFKKIL